MRNNVEKEYQKNYNKNFSTKKIKNFSSFSFGEFTNGILFIFNILCVMLSSYVGKLFGQNSKNILIFFIVYISFKIFINIINEYFGLCNNINKVILGIFILLLSQSFGFISILTIFICFFWNFRLTENNILYLVITLFVITFYKLYKHHNFKNKTLKKLKQYLN